MPFWKPLVSISLVQRLHSCRTGHLRIVNEQLQGALVFMAHISTTLIHVYLQIVMIIAQKWHQLQLQHSENISDLGWLEQQQHRNYNHLTSITTAPSLDYSSQQIQGRKIAKEGAAQASSTKETFIHFCHAHHFQFPPSSFFYFTQYWIHKQNKKKIYNFSKCPLMCYFLQNESRRLEKET